MACDGPFPGAPVPLIGIRRIEFCRTAESVTWDGAMPWGVANIGPEAIYVYTPGGTADWVVVPPGEALAYCDGDRCVPLMREHCFVTLDDR